MELKDHRRIFIVPAISLYCIIHNIAEPFFGNIQLIELKESFHHPQPGALPAFPEPGSKSVFIFFIICIFHTLWCLLFYPSAVVKKTVQEEVLLSFLPAQG
jgi:hypothetical protein